MRVLHVHSGNIYGGVETMLLTQVRGRNLYRGMDSSFALCFAGRFSEELTKAGAPVHWLGEVRIRQPLSVRRARLKLRELLRQRVFDVVVTHSCWSQAIFGAAARAAGLPLVFYLHNPADGSHWLERWGSRTIPDIVLCNSEFTAATATNLFPRVRKEVVYCPVARPAREYSQAERAATRLELQTPEDAVVIIQASRMESWKGHALHLEALSMMKDLPGWVCWQVGGAQRSGEAKYLGDLESRAAQLGIADRVRFLGQRSDVEKLLAAADIYCQPNTGPEPFGIAFVEALYAQLPVITTAIGGAREIVNDTCGLLVPPNDTLATAEALRRLIQNRPLREKLGSGGAERARELCDVETQTQRLSEYYSDACRRQLQVQSAIG